MNNSKSLLNMICTEANEASMQREASTKRQEPTSDEYRSGYLAGIEAAAEHFDRIEKFALEQAELYGPGQRATGQAHMNALNARMYAAEVRALKGDL